jgi:CubicO group peptidase (beta-lactamase class C family)
LKGFVTVPPDKANLTMRMLMNHTSGLSGTADAPCLSNRMTTLQLCAQQILNLPLSYTPGAHFDYGGNSMQLAGYVAEVLSGKSWSQFFAEKIGTPLGLTRFTYGNSQNPRVPGGAVSDVGDYTRLMQMYLAGGTFGSTRILSRQTYYEMQSDQRRGLPALNNPGGKRLTKYSYGWWHSSAEHLQDQPSPTTPGPELSDQGAFGCTPWIDFEHNYTAIILVSSNVPAATLIWNDARPLIIEQMQKNP